MDFGAGAKGAQIRGCDDRDGKPYGDQDQKKDTISITHGAVPVICLNGIAIIYNITAAITILNQSAAALGN
jgi:hypothetical protein